MEKPKKTIFPGVLWILPILFGLIGGVIAGLIASLKYEASWWELVLVGFIINVLVVIGYILLFTSLLFL